MMNLREVEAAIDDDKTVLAYVNVGGDDRQVRVMFTDSNGELHVEWQERGATCAVSRVIEDCSDVWVEE